MGGRNTRVISNIRNTKYGPGVVNAGTFNMYDGIISGNERNGVMSTNTRSSEIAPPLLFLISTGMALLCLLLSKKLRPKVRFRLDRVHF